MKLHLNSATTQIGFFSKRTAWRTDARIELSPVEDNTLRAHPEIGLIILAKGTFNGNFEMEVNVRTLLGTGMTGSVFDTPANQAEWENNLREGCAALKAYLEQVAAPPSVTAEEF